MKKNFTTIVPLLHNILDEVDTFCAEFTPLFMHEKIQKTKKELEDFVFLERVLFNLCDELEKAVDHDSAQLPVLLVHLHWTLYSMAGVCGEVDELLDDIVIPMRDEILAEGAAQGKV